MVDGGTLRDKPLATEVAKLIRRNDSLFLYSVLEADAIVVGASILPTNLLADVISTICRTHPTQQFSFFCT